MATPNAGSTLELGTGGLPLVYFQGLNTNKASNLSGFLVDASGNVTAPGTLAVTGVATFTAAPVFASGQSEKTVNSSLVGATVVLTAAQSGTTFINVSTSGSPSWTLPAAANGLYYNFVCGNTTTGFTITGAQVVHLKTSATGTALTSTTTVTNTQATAVVGDALQIISDGVAWWMVAQTGIFAVS